jgi:helicase
LLPTIADWEIIADPIEANFVTAILTWAWAQASLTRKARQAFRLADEVNTDSVRDPFFNIVRMWLAGASFHEISDRLEINVDDLLGVYAQVISFELQTIVEQGVALLKKLLEGQGKELSFAVEQFPELLRFGVPTIHASLLAEGLRHRRAAIELGSHEIMQRLAAPDGQQVFTAAQEILQTEQRDYAVKLGRLVLDHTIREITIANRRRRQ